MQIGHIVTENLKD